MDVVTILQHNPLMALFLAVAAGYFIGKFRVGNFELGGIAGTLIAAVLIGQIGLHVDAAIQNIFFALFIYMVGYNGGPQFFSSINRSTLNQVIAAIVMTVTGLVTVLAAAKYFDLHAGLAAGLAAGGLTQSAIIGTAGGAIDQLGLTAEAAKLYKTNVAVGYSVTYIFGSLGPILMVTAFFPLLYRWNLRQEATKLAEKLGGGSRQLGEGEFYPLKKVVSRLYLVTAGSAAVGQTIEGLEQQFDTDITVEEVARNDKLVSFEKSSVIAADDLLLITGLTREIGGLAAHIGVEQTDDAALFDMVEEHRDVVLTNREFNGLTVQQFHDKVGGDGRRGVYLSRIERMVRQLPVLPGTVLNNGDELTLVGKAGDLDHMVKLVGYKAPSKSATEYVTFGLGMVVGFYSGKSAFQSGQRRLH